MHIYLFNCALPPFFFLSQGKTQTMFNLLHNFNENILQCLSSERVLSPPNAIDVISLKKNRRHRTVKMSPMFFISLFNTAGSADFDS